MAKIKIINKETKQPHFVSQAEAAKIKSNPVTAGLFTYPKSVPEPPEVAKAREDAAAAPTSTPAPVIPPTIAPIAVEPPRFEPPVQKRPEDMTPEEIEKLFPLPETPKTKPTGRKRR